MSSDPSYWLERSYHNLIEIRFGFKFKFISTRPHIHAGSGCSITSFTTHNYKRPFAAVGHSICMICWTFVWSVGLLAYWIGKKQGIIFPNAIICLYRPCVEQERNGVRIHISRYTASKHVKDSFDSESNFHENVKWMNRNLRVFKYTSSDIEWKFLIQTFHFKVRKLLTKYIPFHSLLVQRSWTFPETQLCSLENRG